MKSRRSVFWGPSEYLYCRCKLPEKKRGKKKKDIKHRSSGLLLQGDDRRRLSLAGRCVLGHPICYRGESALRQSPWINVKMRHSLGQCPDSHTLMQTTVAVKMSLPVLPLHSKLPSLAGKGRSNRASVPALQHAHGTHFCWPPTYCLQIRSWDTGMCSLLRGQSPLVAGLVSSWDPCSLTCQGFRGTVS